MKRYSIYVHHLSWKTNHPEKIQSSNNLEQLIDEWHHKNCDSEEFHRLQPNTITTRVEYGIASNLGAFKQMEIKTFKEKASIIRQDSINTPVQHLGYITTIRTLRVLDSGRLRETRPKTPNRVISVEVEGQEIPLDVEFSQALFLEFFPGFTGFGQDSESEVEEYMKQRYWK
jgi:hypothetical protein